MLISLYLGESKFVLNVKTVPSLVIYWRRTTKRTKRTKAVNNTRWKSSISLSFVQVRKTARTWFELIVKNHTVCKTHTHTHTHRHHNALHITINTKNKYIQKWLPYTPQNTHTYMQNNITIVQQHAHHRLMYSKLEYVFYMYALKYATTVPTIKWTVLLTAGHVLTSASSLSSYFIFSFKIVHHLHVRKFSWEFYQTRYQL